MIRATMTILVLLAGFANEAMAAPPMYTLLEITGPGSQGYAYALNESGNAVGAARFGNSDVHAFLYSSATGVTSDLGTFGGKTSVANDINESGSVTGWASKKASSIFDPDESLPFLYQGGSLNVIDLTPIGRSNGAGGAINDSGQIIGSAFATAEQQGATTFLFDGNNIVDLGTLGGHTSYPGDINEAGTIVGSSFTSNGHVHAYVYDGKMHDLGGFGGPFDYSAAAAINEFGLIVGESTDATTNRGRAVAFINGEILNLGTLAGFDSDRSSSALAVNNHGDIVGRSGTADLPIGRTHGFLYQDGAMYDLNSLIVDARGLVVSEAWDINDARQIVGIARAADLTSRAVLLTPIPEPSTLALLGAGLLLIAAVVRRERARRLLAHASRRPVPGSFSD
jgi:probable HAF family extracellular repeat protein